MKDSPNNIKRWCSLAVGKFTRSFMIILKQCIILVWFQWYSNYNKNTVIYALYTNICFSFYLQLLHTHAIQKENSIYFYSLEDRAAPSTRKSPNCSIAPSRLLCPESEPNIWRNVGQKDILLDRGSQLDIKRLHRTSLTSNCRHLIQLIATLGDWNAHSPRKKSRYSTVTIGKVPDAGEFLFRKMVITEQAVTFVFPRCCSHWH